MGPHHALYYERRHLCRPAHIPLAAKDAGAPVYIVPEPPRMLSEGPCSMRLNIFLFATCLALVRLDAQVAPGPPTHSADAPGLFDRQNLTAWCVVPFDAKKRGPEQRAEMLQRLGFKNFAYDWREKDVPTFDAEVEALKRYDINLVAWWFPTDAADPNARIILEVCKRHSIHPQLWVMGSGSPTTTEAEQKQRTDQEAERIRKIVELAKPYDCPVELYNHNGWFGEPDNEVAVIERLKQLGVSGVGMVYNFSHGHKDVADFPAIWKRIERYVVAVNVTGMVADERLIPPSQGNYELAMLRTIQQSGWRGPIGLIAEQGGDAEVTLGNNLRGLDSLNSELERSRPASGPIGVSQNGRYFVTARGEPFYFLADTQWELFRRFSINEARMILENRKAKGFTVVMVMLTGVGDGTGPNLDGEHPWLSDNPLTPNPAYFAHVDAVVALARANDLQLLIGIYHQTYGRRMTVDKAKPWAAWVTARYHDQPNIIWTIYPRATDAYGPIVRRFAAGIQEGDRGKHLISMHPDPSPASSSFMHEEPWLSFNSIQVWNQLGSVYPMTLADYQSTPAKPATMLEGVYENGEEYGYPITPLLVRREAYYTCLAGGFHGYGHNDSWRVRARWRAALDDPGAQQMRVLKKVMTGLPDWWTLTPDQTVLRSGGNTNGEVLNLSARSAAGKWLMAYIAGQPEVTVNLTAITAADSASVKWINPASGSQEAVGTYAVIGPRSFRKPAGWPDALLVATAEDSSATVRGRPPPPAYNPK